MLALQYVSGGGHSNQSLLSCSRQGVQYVKCQERDGEGEAETEGERIGERERSPVDDQSVPLQRKVDPAMISTFAGESRSASHHSQLSFLGRRELLWIISVETIDKDER